MEDKKVIKMDKLKATPQPEKVSYEKLEEIARQLQEQNKQLYMKCMELQQNNLTERFHYVFEVAKDKVTFSKELVDKALNEVENTLYPPQEESCDEECSIGCTCK